MNFELWPDNWPDYKEKTMVENVDEKIKNKTLDFAFAESGNIVVIEKKFDEDSGVPIMKPTQETNSKHLADLLSDHDEQVWGPAQKKRRDLVALQKAVAEKEAEREKLVNAKAKEKAK
jgi:hypothetical protein